MLLLAEDRAAAAQRFEALRKEGRSAIEKGNWDEALEKLRAYAEPTQGLVARKDRTKGKLRRVLAGLSNEKLAQVHERAQGALRQDLASVKQVIASIEAEGGDAAGMQAQQKELEAMLGKYQAAVKKGMTELEARAISKELGEVAKKLEAELKAVEGAKAPALADESDAAFFDKEQDLKDPKTTTKFFTDYRGGEALGVYGSGVRTRDRGFPAPPVGSDMGLIMEDPKMMDPRVNPDLPYTIDDAEGMIVLHFHSGPYKGEELVLASVSPTLEWVVPSPPPLHLFEESPIVKEHPEEWAEIEHSH